MNSNSDQKNTPFNKLLNDNWDYVFNYILKKTSDDYIAEEITIQTFSKAFQKIKLYDKKFSFKTWLISIAKNTYADQLRKKKSIIDNYENIEKHNYSRSPEEDFIEKESYDELKEKINQLKPNYKEVLKYRYFDDLSIKEISKKLNQPISTIKIKIFRAKKLLIEKIKNND